MKAILGIIVPVLVLTSVCNAQTTKPSVTPKPGPSAASMAMPYRGPLKFNARVLATERTAGSDLNPITRAASWRYRYSSPFTYYGGYYGYCGYRPYRGFFPFTGGATGCGFWGPSY